MDNQILAKYAQYAIDSYEDNENMISVEHTVANIHEETDSTIITVRGTDDCRDWAFNFYKCQVPFYINQNSYGQVHKGFYNTMKSLLPYLVIGKQKPLYLVGHSLGGAVAVLLGLHLAVTRPSQNICVITFGAPRIGDRELQNKQVTNLRIYRIFNPKDMITYLPYFNYSHMGIPICVNTSYKHHNFGKNHSIHTYLEAFEPSPLIRLHDFKDTFDTDIR